MTSLVTSDDLPSTPHALPAGAVLDALDVSVGAGLGDEEIRRRTQVFGPNAIVARRPVSALDVLVHQFQSPVVYLLAAAAALAFYFGEIEEGGAIIIVLAINALIGFVTEIRAARSIEALRALGTHSVRVRRDGHTRLIPAEALVPGDIVLVEGGDSVSADLRLVEASHLGADESTLTGESVAVEKATAPVAADARLGDRHSMLFKGTSLTRGSGVGVVVATGVATELGHISKLVEEAEPETSPLERRLSKLSGQLVWAVIALTVIIAASGIGEGKNTFLMVEAAIALAVAAIPEGLPIVATLALARGMLRMARQNALDRAAVGSGDPRRHHRHPHRQDWHPDREPYDRGPALGAIRRNRDRRRRRCRAVRRRSPDRISPGSRRACATTPHSARPARTAPAIRWNWRCCALDISPA